MIRKSPLVLLACLLTAFSPRVVDTARAQEASKPKGFKYANPKEKDAPKAIPVVRGDEESHPVKIWKLDFAGPSSTRRQHVIPIVEDVTLYSNGKMRLHFAMRNLGERDDNVRMNFDRFYLIDYPGETYKPLARDIALQDRMGSDVEFRAGTKTRFWMEFDAPKKPESKFKVFLGTDHTSNGSTEHNEFPPFIITLKEPISAQLNDAPEEAAPVTEGGTPSPERPVPIVDGTSGGGRAKAATPQALANAIRAIVQKAQRFEGPARPASGVSESVAIAFQPDPEDADGVIAQLFPKNAPAKKTALQGWIMPDATKPGAFLMKLKGGGKTYQFTYDGKILTGTDNKEGRYTLLKAR